MECKSCGATWERQVTFCGSCGAPIAAEVPSFASGRPPSPALKRLEQMPKWVTDLVPPESFERIPQPLWIGIGILAAAGALALLPAMWNVPSTFQVFQYGPFGRAIGLLALASLTVLGACGVACLYLATLLYRADRAGRVLTIALGGCLGVGELLAEDKGGADVLVILGCAAVVGILTLVEEVRAYYSGPFAVQSDVPTPVVASRAIVVCLAFMLGLIGLVFLPISQYDAKFGVIGAVLIAVSVAGFRYSAGLLLGDVNARNIVSGLMGAYVIAVLLAEPKGAGLLVPIALAATVAGLLWASEESRAYFTPKP